MASFIGTIEAGLRHAQAYKRGGVGPLFSEERLEAPFSLSEFLHRTLRAFEKLKIHNAALLFVGETEVYRESDLDEGEKPPAFDELRSAADEALEDEPDAIAFYLIVTHEDRDFSHVFCVEADIDYHAESPAIAIVDVAEPLGEDNAFAKEDMLLDRLAAVVERLMEELSRELALDDPEADVWVDVAGDYDMLRAYQRGVEEQTPPLE